MVSNIFASAICALAVVEAFDMKPFYTPDTPYPQTMNDNYNLLKFVGNRGPYSDRRGVGLNRDAPDNCQVDQVVMLARHGERWPSTGDFKDLSASVKKVKSVEHPHGPLAFVDEWEMIASSDSGWLEEETFVGPYSGLLDAYYHGVQYRRRYGHLYDGQSSLPLFISAYQRDADTGRKFGEGFLAWNYTDLAAVNFVLENNGANSLSPSCELKEKISTTLCPDFTYYKEFDEAAQRLNKLYPGMNLNSSDVYNLLDLVSYELNVRGSSPWVSVFTSQEWVAYEYYVDALYYCTAGPGSVTGPIIGSLFLNGTRNLLVKGPEESNLPLAFSFAHDTDILKLAATMGLDAPENVTTFDPTQLRFNSSYHVVEIVPQGARFVFERLTCRSDANEPDYYNEFPDAFNSSTYINGTSNSTNTYVRIVVNEAVVPINECATGPGASCPIDDFSNWVDTHLEGRDFVENCVIPDSDPTEFTVFTNYSLSNEFNADSPYEPFRGRTLNSTGQPVK